LGALFLALCFALLAWRTWLGGLNAYQTQSGSMMLGLPEWYVYAAMVPPFILTTVIALYQCFFGFGGEEGASA
jgi:TRAP-type C4-dicarboxylate transport system permease small subunit